VFFYGAAYQKIVLYETVGVRLSVPSFDSSSDARLLSALRVGDIDQQLPAPTPLISCNGAAARRSATNAGSVMLRD